MGLKKLLTNLEKGENVGAALDAYPKHKNPIGTGPGNSNYGQSFTPVFEGIFRQKSFKFGEGTSFDRPGESFSRQPYLFNKANGPQGLAGGLLSGIEGVSDAIGGVGDQLSDSGVDENGRQVAFAGKLGAVDGDNTKRIFVTQVFFRSPRAMWRFYGYYGGIGVVGNASTYGQFADDSTFELVPTWQNKMQAIMYEDSIFTRTSHFSYEIKNNKLRLFPPPTSDSAFVNRMEIWFKFYIKEDSTADAEYDDGLKGVNNLNTLPFENIPFANINSMGQQWIRKYALALCKEMLGQIRGKFTTIPIPGESVTLNHSELLSQAKEEQALLKEKLMEVLKETEYQELSRLSSEKAESATKTFSFSPLPIFVG